MAKCWNFHSRAHWLLVFGSLNLNGFYRHPFWETKDAEVIRWIARKDCQASPVPDQRAQHIQPRFKYEPCPNKPKHFYTSRLSLTTSTYCVYNMVRSLLCRCWIIKLITWRFLLLTLICCFRWMWDIDLLPSEIIRYSFFSWRVGICRFDSFCSKIDRGKPDCRNGMFLHRRHRPRERPHHPKRRRPASKPRFTDWWQPATKNTQTLSNTIATNSYIDDMRVCSSPSPWTFKRTNSPTWKPSTCL